MERSLAIFLVILVIYTLFSRKLNQISITMPMFFVFIGAVTGPQALGWIGFPIESHSIEIITESTLALLLFADASTLSFRRVQIDRGLPSRLLFIAMPLSLILGALIAFGFFHEEWVWFALLLAAILAPTDAALGLSIFNNPLVPIRVRQALNVESGLNDGIASPLVTLFAALAVAEGSYQMRGDLIIALIQIGIALGVGTIFGMVGGRLFTWASKRELTSSSMEQIGIFALGLGTFLCSGTLGGNGFIAVFVAGLLFGYTTHHQEHIATEFTEVIGNLLSTFVWTVFGGLIIIDLFIQFNPLALLYGLLSLTVIRMLPVAISMVKTRFRPDTILLMGWFGPRGLASVVFLLVAFDIFHEAGRPHELMFAMGGWTILLSVILHGITASPFARIYANRMKSAPPDAPELVEVHEVHSRGKNLTTRSSSS